MFEATPAAAAASGEAQASAPAWMSKPITGEMLQSVIQLLASRSNAPETATKIMADFTTIMDSGDPHKAGELLKPEKRGRGRPRIKQEDDANKKHRDLGSYNLFVMKAQNVAGSDVKNHRAFMALIGSFWKGMDQETRDEFNSTYKGLLDQLNEKKKAGIKYDFAHELKVYERDNELDTIGYFKGFMAQVKKLPLPETKAEKDAKEAAAAAAKLNPPTIPQPTLEDEEEEDEEEDDDDDDEEEEEEEEEAQASPPAKVVPAPPVVAATTVKKKKRQEAAPPVEEAKKKKKKKDKVLL